MKPKVQFDPDVQQKAWTLGDTAPKTRRCMIRGKKKGETPGGFCRHFQLSANETPMECEAPAMSPRKETTEVKSQNRCRGKKKRGVVGGEVIAARCRETEANGGTDRNKKKPVLERPSERNGEKNARKRTLFVPSRKSQTEQVDVHPLICTASQGGTPWGHRARIGTIDSKRKKKRTRGQQRADSERGMQKGGEVAEGSGSGAGMGSEAHKRDHWKPKTK